ncbi:MAG: hypothetical protein WD689_02105 [Gaiellaceae bacterium]
MFGLDDVIANWSDETTILLVSVVATLLGLRHATDPDHVAAVSTLVASSRERATRTGAVLGAAWGAGHAVTLFLLGLPILLFGAYLPERAQQAAETAIGVLIVYLAVRLLMRWRSGGLQIHGHPDAHGARTAIGAFGIGLAHGIGGSAGVGILIVASVESTGLAVAALALLALFTAVSMTVLTAGFGRMLASRPVRTAYGVVAPGLGVASLAFGIWYATAAWAIAPYPF